MTEQLTFYTTRGSPFAASVEIALKEAKLDYTQYLVNLEDKPEWFTSQVNPIGKVPAITYGGPKVSPDQPSPEAHKVAESLVILEFIADISGKLLPKDPAGRARARFFTDTVTRPFLPTFYTIIMKGGSVDELIKVVETIQSLLPEDGYVAGPDFSIADAAIAPVLGILDLSLSHDIGAYEEGTGHKGYDILQTGERFARYRKYFKDIQARDSYKTTFDKEYLLERFSKRFGPDRTGKKVAPAASP